MIESSRLKLGVAWLVLILAISCLYFRISLHSDSLFLEALASDIFSHNGNWQDWRLTPAPAYVPDILLYFLGYWLMPDAAWRIFFVVICQAVILTSAALWLARKIQPNLSIDARTTIILTVAIVSLVAARSGMWLYFNTTNNHFSSLLFAFLVLGLAIDFLAQPRFYRVLLIIILGGIAKASSAIFLICFVIPAALACVLAIASITVTKDKVLLQYRNRLIGLFGLLVISQFFAIVIDFLLTYNDPLKDRTPISIEAAAHSFKLFLQATGNAFLIDNRSTFLFSLIVTFAFAFLAYRLFRKVSLVSNELAIKLPISSQTGIDWRVAVCAFLLILVIPINLSGSILSGGFADTAGYRYFMFPIALALILTIITFNGIWIFKKRRNGVAIYIVAMLLACADIQTFSKQYAFSSDAWREQIQTNRFPNHENEVANCLAQLEHSGIKLKSGIADYWLARGVSNQMRDQNPIFAVTNDLNPFFWMSTIGPIRRPENYPEYKYNFVLLRSSEAKFNPFNFTPLTIGKLLPENRKTHLCPGTDLQIWTYGGDELDLVVKAVHSQYLFRQKLSDSVFILGRDLPGITGQIQGLSRTASAPNNPAGFLSYGPYINLTKGRYKVTVSYSAKSSDAKIGFFDMGRFENPKDPIQLYKHNLIPALNSSDTSIINIPAQGLERFEARTWFDGNGDLTIHSIKIEKILTQD